MGTLTYTQIKTEALAALGNRTGFDEDRFVAILNLSQMRIARFRRWEELDATTNGTLVITADATVDKTLAMPSNTRDIYSFRIITEGVDGFSRKLVRRTYRWFDRNVPEPEYYTRGTPTDYMRFAGQLEMYRVPDNDDDYIIRRCSWPTDFDKTAGQVSDFTQKDDMLVALTISWMFQTLGRLEDAGRWFTTYANMLNSAMGEDAEVPDQLIAPDFEHGSNSCDRCDILPYVTRINYP